MHCPVCNRATLFSKMVETPLAMECCTECGGKWLSAKTYWSWIDSLKQPFPEKEYSEIKHEVNDSGKAKICVDCGRILVKYKIGHNLNFHLDHCDHCNGVWFDKNEWEILRDRNLHDEIHKIFTTPWQNKVRLEEKQAYFDTVYQDKFGENYSNLKAFKVWLDSHELKASILAYLTDPKPYK